MSPLQSSLNQSWGRPRTLLSVASSSYSRSLHGDPAALHPADASASEGDVVAESIDAGCASTSEDLVIYYLLFVSCSESA